MAEEKQPDNDRLKKGFVRQLVMLEEINKLQLGCYHTLDLLNQNTLTCLECGALWKK